MKTVLACPRCDTCVNPDANRRAYCDGGRKAAPEERWICRECDTTFAEPTRRPSKREVDRYGV